MCFFSACNKYIQWLYFPPVFCKLFHVFLIMLCIHNNIFHRQKRRGWNPYLFNIKNLDVPKSRSPPVPMYVQNTAAMHSNWNSCCLRGADSRGEKCNEYWGKALKIIENNAKTDTIRSLILTATSLSGLTNNSNRDDMMICIIVWLAGVPISTMYVFDPCLSQ